MMANVACLRSVIGIRQDDESPSLPSSSIRRTTRRMRLQQKKSKQYHRPFASKTIKCSGRNASSLLVWSFMLSFVFVNATLFISAFSPPIVGSRKQSLPSAGKIYMYTPPMRRIQYHQLLVRFVKNTHIHDPSRKVTLANDIAVPESSTDLQPEKQKDSIEATYNDVLEASTAATMGLAISSVDNKDDSRNNISMDSLPEEALGLVVLATVPIVWGSYVPVVRGLYEIDPPIPGFVFSTAYFFVASVSMSCLLMLQHTKQQHQQEWERPAEPEEISHASENATRANPQMTSTKSRQEISSWKNSVQAGAELGFYLFLGNSLQVLGLKTVPSDRAGFLVQLTTILVPLVQAVVSGDFLASVSFQTWLACILALTGIAVMGYDGTDVGHSLMSHSTHASIMPSLTMGDCLILGAAFVYSLHVVRLGRWANETEPLQLVAYKATTELILSLVLITVLIKFAADTSISSTIGISATAAAANSNLLVEFCRESGQEIVTFFDSLWERIQSQTLSVGVIQKALGATLWTGLATTAYTTYAQTYGQRRVKPADANLIYSMQPIFTALFAYALLGETMGLFGFGGGALIGGAVYLAASQSFSSSRKNKSDKIVGE